MSSTAYAHKHKLLGLCRNCIKPLAKGSTIYCGYHREKGRMHGRERSKREIAKLKEECLNAYGRECVCCGEKTKEFLTIDHEGGKGNDHRKRLFGYNVGGVHMYRWLRKNKFPKGYRILCMNCNWGTRLSLVCPHKQGEVAEWSKALVY